MLCYLKMMTDCWAKGVENIHNHFPVRSLQVVPWWACTAASTPPYNAIAPGAAASPFGTVAIPPTLAPPTKTTYQPNLPELLRDLCAGSFHFLLGLRKRRLVNLLYLQQRSGVVRFLPRLACLYQSSLFNLSCFRILPYCLWVRGTMRWQSAISSIPSTLRSIRRFANLITFTNCFRYWVLIKKPLTLYFIIERFFKEHRGVRQKVYVRQVCVIETR